MLWEAWTEGRTLTGLPAELRPLEIREGYAVQAELDKLVGRRVGWKIAATGAGGQAALGVEHPLAGPLFEQFSLAPGHVLDFAPIRMRTVEAEFGFAMAHDLPPTRAPFDRAAILAALGAFVPAIEIPNTRYDDHRSAGGPQLVADAACAGFFVLGKPVTDYDPAALPAVEVTLTTSSASGTGSGAKVLGDPVEAVRWLANALAAQDRGLSAGELVITGSAIATRDPGSGPVVADFGDLGSVRFELL